METERPAPRRWSRLKKTLLACAAVLLGLVLAVSCLPTRGWLPAGGGLVLQATSLKSNHTISRATSTSGDGPLAASRIALVVIADHPLMRWVTPLVRERLEELPFVREVRLTEVTRLRDAAAALPPGADLPDLCVVLRLQDVAVGGFALSGRSLDTTIAFHAGPTLFSSSHHRSDRLDPPTIRLSARGTLHHESETTGYESADARHQAAGVDIGNSLADSIGELLAKTAEERGTLGAVPAGFVPAYAPTPPGLPLPVDAALTLLASGRGPFTTNQTTWLAESDDPAATLDRLHRALADDGWRVTDHALDDPEASPHLFATRENERYEAFATRLPGNSATEDLPEGEMAILYTARQPDADVRTAFPPFDAASLPELEALGPLDKRMSDTQRRSFHEALLARFTGAEPISADAAWRLAEGLRASGRSEDAVSPATRAWWLEKILGRDERVRAIEEGVAAWPGRSERKRWEPEAPNQAEAVALGFRLLAAGESTEAVLPLGAPLVVAMPGAGADADADATPRLIAAVVLHADDAAGPYALTVVEVGTGFRSGSSITPDAPAGAWSAEHRTGFENLRVRVTAEERPHADGASPTFAVTLRLEAEPDPRTVGP